MAQLYVADVELTVGGEITVRRTALLVPRTTTMKVSQNSSLIRQLANRGITGEPPGRAILDAHACQHEDRIGSTTGVERSAGQSFGSQARAFELSSVACGESES